jgi:type IV pilus assembly protein PilQ
LTEERDALKSANDSETQLEPLTVKYIRVNYARADEALVDKVKGVLSDRGAVTFDDRTNTIIVRDIGNGIADASHLIKELDIQSPQVLIEANIVEASQDFSRGLGIQWGYRYEAGPTTGNPTGSNFPGTVGFGGSGLGSGLPPVATGTGTAAAPVPFLASFPVPSSFGSGFGPGSGSALDLALGSIDGSHSLSARITALENDGKAKVISRPRVITMNNVAATIQSLTIIRVKLPSTGTIISTGGGGASGGNTATEKINTGITLVVTPQVSSDGYVLMNIYAKSSLPDFTRAVDGIPSEISREANSNVLIRNGDTVVLGGIYRHTGDDREDGLPYLSKVPAIGWLFKRTLESSHHEELLVFLTPKVVEAGTAALPPAERLWQERRGG